jgi:hypothetical protein
MTISLFLITAAVLVAAVVTVIVCNVSATNAQSSNMKTKTLTGPNMTKTTNMTAGGGNMTKSDLAAYSECLRSSCDLF